MNARPTLSHRFGSHTLDYYYCPAKELSLSDVRDIHTHVIQVNRGAKCPLSHKLLEPMLSVDQLKEQYQEAIVVLIKQQGITVGFQFCPILTRGNDRILHAGLVMINSNKGANLLGFASIGVTLLASKKLGSIYFTNITSTPSIVEAVSRLGTAVWPSPDMNLIRPPAGYKDIVQTLVDSYVMKYFPHQQDIQFDKKRFVIRSSSKDMGFKTDPRQLSRPSDFRFFNFCFLWLDYDKEEDLIQVGRIDRKAVFKAKLYYLSVRLKYLLKNKEESSSLIGLEASHSIVRPKERKNA